MHRLLIAVALLLLAPLATAQVYKWTDPSGTVHYSETPPPQGTKYQQVKTSVGTESAAAPAPEASSGGNSDADASKPVTDTPENRSKLCETLRANIAALQGSGPVVMQQSNGKATSLDDDQRKQQAGTAQAQYQQYCQS